MFDEEKLKAIAEYLETEFDILEIYDREDFDREAQTFRIDESNRIYLITVAREFIECYDAIQIASILSRDNLKRYFQNEEDRRLVFSGHGRIRMEQE